MATIEVSHLHKRYGDLTAVGDVSFSVEAGQVFCLLGPNGAGKTTTTEILEGHRLPSGGSARVLGHDPGKGERALRDRIGVVLQDTAVQPELTIGELLEMYGRWYTKRRSVDELIALVDLDASRDVRAEDLSGGQRRRLDLALALVGDPEVLFLDEPTTGFDPHARRAAWETVRSLGRLSGKTVFLTTHFMDEAQELADEVAVMVGGEIVASGPPEQIGGRDRAPTEIRFALPAGSAVGDLPDLGTDVTVSEDGHGVLVATAHGVATAHALTGWALERDLELGGFTVAQPTLEDVYLALTETPA